METTHKKSKRVADIFAGILFILLFIIDQADINIPIYPIIFLIGIYVILAIYAIGSIKQDKNFLNNRLFPYKWSFVGVDYWFIFLVGLLLGTMQSFENESLEQAEGLLIGLFWMFDLIVRVVKNRKKLYNLYFDEDQIIINEDQYNEILYSDILSIERLDQDTFKLLIKNNKEEKVILNVDRISKKRRAALVREVHALKTALELE